MWTILLLNCDCQLQCMLSLPTQICSKKILSQLLITFLWLLCYQLIFPSQNWLNALLTLQCQSNSREDLAVHCPRCRSRESASLSKGIGVELWCDSRSKSLEGCRPDSLLFVGNVAPGMLHDVVIDRGQEGVRNIPSTHSLPYSKGQSF